MIKAIDVKAELAGLKALHGRSTATTAAETQAAFAVLAPFGNGSIFAGSFSGRVPGSGIATATSSCRSSTAPRHSPS